MIVKILLLLIPFMISNPTQNIQQEDSKVLLEKAISDMSLSSYRRANDHLKILYSRNYCNKNALNLLLSYSLTMDDNRSSASYYMNRVDESAFSDEIQVFSGTLETFIKEEGPSLTSVEYQKLLDYINPPLHGQSQHLNDLEKERFLIRREYIRRYFKSGLEALQRNLRDTNVYDDGDDSSYDGWGGEVTYPSQEELDYYSSDYYLRSGDSYSYDTETSDIDFSNYQWDADIDMSASTFTSANGIIDQLMALFNACE